jgi:hypothetical protein
VVHISKGLAMSATPLGFEDDAKKEKIADGFVRQLSE